MAVVGIQDELKGKEVHVHFFGKEEAQMFFFHIVRLSADFTFYLLSFLG